MVLKKGSSEKPKIARSRKRLYQEIETPEPTTVGKKGVAKKEAPQKAAPPPAKPVAAKPVAAKPVTAAVAPKPAPTAAASADAAGRREAEAGAVVKTCVMLTMGVSVIPIPFLDIVAHTGILLKMLKDIADIYGVPFRRDLGKSIIAALVSGYGSMALAGNAGALLGTMIPGIGLAATLATRPALTGALTYAIGAVFIRHFGEGGTLFDLDLARSKTDVAAAVTAKKKSV
jgi:uncharacterized protein (DUF697 family)